VPPEPPPAVDFYDRHPIKETQGLEAQRRRGRDLRALVPEDLYRNSFLPGGPRIQVLR